MTSEPCPDPIHTPRHLLACTLVVLAGCIVPGTDDGTPSCTGGKCDGYEDPTKICTLPERTRDRAAADHYRTFASVAERDAYVTDFLAFLGKQAAADQSAARSLQDQVDRLYPAFVAELPAELAGMTTPPSVVMIDSPEVNAFAASDPRDNPRRAPWVFFVNTGLVASSSTGLNGVLAHELAHLIAKHQFEDAPALIRKHYSVVGRDESTVAPSLEHDDPEVKSLVAQYEELARYAGVFDVPEIRGLPVAVSGLRTGVRYDAFVKVLGLSQTAECAAVMPRYNAVQAILRGHISKFDHQLRLDAAAVDTIDPDLDSLLAALRACAAATGPSLAEVAAVVELETATPERRQMILEAPNIEALRALVLDAEEAAIDEGPGDFVTKLLTLGRSKQAKMSAFVSSVPYASLRRYAEEVEADEIAVRVLHQAEIAPTEGGDFLLSQLTGQPRGTCDQELAMGRVPPFGGFGFLHPAICWRVWHAQQFASAVEQHCARRAR